MKRVYFIRPIGQAGPVKIGCSVGPNKRRHELETWSPVPLEIVAEIDGGFDIERRFHAKFQDTHERREWFTWSQGLDDTITAINAGAFDVSTLPEPVQITQRIVIPVKTENHRKCASYWSRATQTMLRTGYRTKVDTCGMDVEKTPERFVQLEAYFAAPHIHGEPAFGDKAAKARCRYHESAAA